MVLEVTDEETEGRGGVRASHAWALSVGKWPTWGNILLRPGLGSTIEAMNLTPILYSGGDHGSKERRAPTWIKAPQSWKHQYGFSFVHSVYIPVILDSPKPWRSVSWWKGVCDFTEGTVIKEATLRLCSRQPRATFEGLPRQQPKGPEMESHKSSLGKR